MEMNKNYEEFRKECIKAIEVLGINNRAVEIRMLKTKKVQSVVTMKIKKNI